MAYGSAFRSDLFQNQVVLVTGGGSGIGRCVAHELTALGAAVAIAGRKPEKLDAVAAEIADAGGTVSTHICDIRQDDQVAAMVEAVLARHGRIDGLFNNAGGQFYAPIEEISTNGFNAVVSTNLVGGFIVMREVFKRWMKANGGAIVNMTADVWMGLPAFPHSGAARAGMESLTQSTAAQWAAHGVRVNSIAPGGIESSGFDNYSGEFQEILRNSPRSIPAQRFGTVSEVSAGVVFLLSPAAAFITGTSLRVDGGGPNARSGWMPGKPACLPAFSGFHLPSSPRIFDGQGDT
ncbi:MAG: SDR family oxidoreductase [Sphingomonadales bacterium]|nr:SDR family oxidoreductase [Sphingomonadales bacterium]